MTNKVVLVGDKGTGKTSFLRTLTTGKFSHDYLPNSIDHHIELNQGVAIDLIDTSGGAENALLRSFKYTGNPIFLICFSVANRHGFLNIENNWLPEIKYHAPNAPVILVGMQSDLRDSNPNAVSNLEIQELQQKLNVTYIEISSLTGTNLQNLQKEIKLANLKVDLLAIALEARKESKTTYLPIFRNTFSALSEKITIAKYIEAAVKKTTLQELRDTLEPLFQHPLSEDSFAKKAIAKLDSSNIDLVIPASTQTKNASFNAKN